MNGMYVLWDSFKMRFLTLLSMKNMSMRQNTLKTVSRSNVLVYVANSGATPTLSEIVEFFYDRYTLHMQNSVYQNTFCLQPEKNYFLPGNKPYCGRHVRCNKTYYFCQVTLVIRAGNIAAERRQRQVLTGGHRQAGGISRNLPRVG